MSKKRLQNMKESMHEVPISKDHMVLGMARDITERRRAKETLETLRRQNELILNAAGEGIYGLDLEGKTTFINPAAAKMLGWKVEELIGRYQHDVLHHSKPDGTPYLREDCPIYAAFKDGVIHHVENEVFWKKDGSCFPVEYTSTPIREDGKLVGAVVVFRDISERKQMQEDLNKKNKDLEGLNSITQAVHETLNPTEVYNIALDKIIELQNVEMASIYIVDEVNNEAILQEYRNLPEAYLRKASRIQYPKGVTWKVVKTGKFIKIDNVMKDPEVGPAGRKLGGRSMIGSPIDLEGKTIGVIWIISYLENPFTEYDKELLISIGDTIGIAIAQAKLYESEQEQMQKIEALQKISRAITSELDYSLVLQDIAEYVRRLSGSKFSFVAVKEGDYIYRTKAMAGEDDSYASKIHEWIDINKDLPYECVNFKKCISNKIPIASTDIRNQFKIKYWREQLIERGINSMVVLPLIYKEDVIGVLALYSTSLGKFRDDMLEMLVSFADQAAIALENARLYEETKRKSEELIRLNDEIESINKELKDFAYIVSHDLKAPLRAISSLANWLVADYGDGLDEDVLKHVTLIESRAKRMFNLIDGILQYSRVGRTKEKIVNIDSNNLVKDAIDSLDPPENINFEFENQLPKIACEKTRLGQIFQNLLSNSIKFIDKSAGEIKIGCSEENGFWKFSISDNGPGIEKKYHDKIFKVFQTLSPRDAIESTGIGLSIVKKIIDLYGGKIWVESEVGKGCKFFFTLPKNLRD